LTVERAQFLPLSFAIKASDRRLSNRLRRCRRATFHLAVHSDEYILAVTRSFDQRFELRLAVMTLGCQYRLR
jgi:hypothetical protein